MHVLADNLRSAFNVGGIFRTVDAAGGEMVHLTGYTARPPHPRLMRAAMGADRLVTWKGWPDARLAIEWMAERGIHVLGLEPTSAAVDYRHYPYRLPLCVVIGNEALGISPAVTKRLQGTVRIPMRGYKGSLNVVVALGIVLFRIVEVVGARRMDTAATPAALGRLAALAARVRERADHGVWRWRGIPREFPALTLLLHAPHLRAFDVWSHAACGGVLLMCRPCLRTHGETAAWEPLTGDESMPAETPSALPHHPRSLAFEAAARLAHAAASGGLSRVAFDHLIYELIHTSDLAVHGADPEITRFLDAEGPPQMHAAAVRLTAALLAPRGGAWREDELLYHPEEAGHDPRVDAAVRAVLQMDME